MGMLAIGIVGEARSPIIYQLYEHDDIVSNAILSLLGKVCDSKWAIITISIVVIMTILDSEFIKLFYGTDLDSPGSFHISLFLTFVVITSIINTACIRFVRNQ